jgi:hypothetical protein
MATTTAQPLAELQAAIVRQWDGDYNLNGPDTPKNALASLISRMADPLVDSAARTLEAGGGSAWEPIRTDVGPEAFWKDLRPSQAERLMALVEGAVTRAEGRCAEVILEEITEAAKQFAEEHPDAERA